MSEQQRGFVLPVSIISPTDIARLKREIDAVEGYFQQSKIREGGQQQTAMPRLSKLLDQLAVENKLNLLQDDHRSYVLKSLDILQSSAPVMHISFSVDPPGSYVQKIVYWLRSNVHAQVLVTVGLQPNIGAGCIVRTTNRIFDFSLREYFNDKRDFFIEKMHEAISDQAVIAHAEATPTVTATVPSPEVASAQVADVPIPTQTNVSSAPIAQSAPAITPAVTATATPGSSAASAQTTQAASESEQVPVPDTRQSAEAEQATKIAVNVVATSGGSAR